MSLDCSNCNSKKSVKFCKEAILIFNLDKKKKTITKLYSKNELDNNWFECSICYQTSESNDALKKQYDNFFGG